MGIRPSSCGIGCDYANRATFFCFADHGVQRVNALPKVVALHRNAWTRGVLRCTKGPKTARPWHCGTPMVGQKEKENRYLEGRIFPGMCKGHTPKVEMCGFRLHNPFRIAVSIDSLFLNECRGLQKPANRKYHGCDNFANLRIGVKYKGWRAFERPGEVHSDTTVSLRGGFVFLLESNTVARKGSLGFW